MTGPETCLFDAVHSLFYIPDFDENIAFLFVERFYALFCGRLLKWCRCLSGLCQSNISGRLSEVPSRRLNSFRVVPADVCNIEQGPTNIVVVENCLELGKLDRKSVHCVHKLHPLLK